MPNANDAELTRLFSASVGTGPAVEDNEPNTKLVGPPAPDFWLYVEALAGNALGASGATYTLYLTHVAESGGPALTDFALPQCFDGPTGPLWVFGGLADNYVSLQVFPIPIPEGVKGHVYHYEGRLVGRGNNVVSFGKSNSFILV